MNSSRYADREVHGHAGLVGPGGGGALPLAVWSSCVRESLCRHARALLIDVVPVEMKVVTKFLPPDLDAVFILKRTFVINPKAV